MLIQLISIVTPVFGAVAVGFLWARTNRPFDVASVTALVMYVGTPCLLLATFDEVRLSPAAFGSMVLAMLLCLAAMGLLGAAVLRLAGLEIRSFLPSLMFPNAGNMGLSLCLFAFGEPGLALAIVVFAMIATGQFTLGAALSRGTLEPWGLLRMPLNYAVLLGLAMLFLDVQLPEPVARSFKLLGGLTIPLMLIALGVSLSRLRPGGLPVAFALSLLRILGG
ncbi:MAG: AEC family transporter, partial [Tistlia sp.]